MKYCMRHNDRVAHDNENMCAIASEDIRKNTNWVKGTKCQMVERLSEVEARLVETIVTNAIKLADNFDLGGSGQHDKIARKIVEELRFFLLPKKHERHGWHFIHKYSEESNEA